MTVDLIFHEVIKEPRQKWGYVTEKEKLNGIESRLQSCTNSCGFFKTTSISLVLLKTDTFFSQQTNLFINKI